MNKLLKSILELLSRRDPLRDPRSIEQLKRHEGLRLKIYKCPAGFWTIGYGRNLESNGISKEEAESLLINDIERVERRLRKRIDFFERLTEPRRAAIINMAFNLGVNGLLKWSNTLKDIRDGNYKSAADRIRGSRYALQVGDRAQELASQIESGKYKS